jgi:acyl-CoA thioester hydrolase
MPTPPEHARDYRAFIPITTRWMDNDVYGHVNNVTYYSWFDTAANQWLIREGGLDIAAGPVIGVVVESQCTYRAPVAYPDEIRAGLRVDKLGARSVTYGLAIFRGAEDISSAHGRLVHVFVDRVTRAPVPIPASLRQALERLLLSPRG